jgi:lipoprotein-anchoring transpeptidase ErfK/SrfK
MTTRDRASRRPVYAVAALGLLAVCVLVSGCGGGHAKSAASATVSPSKSLDWSKARQAVGRTSTTSLVAQATVANVAIYSTAGADRVKETLRNPQPSGAPLVFLVQDRRPGWLNVLLPVRPNGATGWIRETDVRLSRHDYRIVIKLTAHTITVYRGAEVIDREPIGVGRKDTPTPGGLYYIKELVRPSDPKGAYGPYAFGLSGFSEVLTSFGGGDGVIGIHGTNDPSGLGKDVSHGCIRMSNAGITKIAEILPLGVPVQVVA